MKTSFFVIGLLTVALGTTAVWAANPQKAQQNDLSTAVSEAQSTASPNDISGSQLLSDAQKRQQERLNESAAIAPEAQPQAG
ncbi:MAG TPA: hypothetical protein VJL60_01965 [Gammaproteobacteria bacterium]|nr:hypothetical protein [Gammaproteobacteria bacterium]